MEQTIEIVREDDNFIVVKKDMYGDVQMMVLEKKHNNQKARFAMALMEKWGMVTGEVDGEDSAGRQKARRMTPDEVATYACDLAAAAFGHFEERGWLLDTSDFAQEMAKSRAER